MNPDDFNSPPVDRYVIDEYLAEGGMGAIFLGKKLGLEGFEKAVVLKQLLPEFTSQREFIDLFLREARLSASLDHANIVHTLDLVAAGDDYFIVMEFVRGGDLRTLLRRIKQRGQRMSPAGALFVAREVLSALAYAHEKRGPDGQPLGLIHRDISPSNVMLSVAGEVKLTDFGIAKASTHKSIFYRVKGKVGYMSPEQAFGTDPLDQRSDLYSLAVCLYEMIAGERLFVADMLSTPDQIYSQPLRTLDQRPDVPTGTDAMLATALATDPNHRYQTALEFQDALVQLSFDNALLFSSRDLSDHLLHVCGRDPDTWSLEVTEPADRPGTELLNQQEQQALQDEDQAPFTGVAFTSVFSEEVAPQPPWAPAPPGGNQEDSPPRHLVEDHATAAARASLPQDARRPHDPALMAAPDPDGTRRLGPPPGRPRPAPRPTPPRPHPGPPTPDQQPPMEGGQETRSRLAQAAPLLVLFALAGVIAAAVGLSGPDLSESPLPSSPTPPVIIQKPDLGDEADLLLQDLSLPPADLPGPGEVSDQGPSTMAGLRVRSTPSGAAVLVDGVEQCQTPCTVGELTPDHVYLLSVRQRGRRPWSSLVDPSDRAGLDISATLTPAPAPGSVGLLKVQTPTQSELFVDGKHAGHVSSEGDLPLPPGEYEVALSHPKKTRRPRHLVKIKAGETTALKDNF